MFKRMASNLRALVGASAMVIIAGCGGGGGSSGSTAGVTLVNIAVTPANPTVTVLTNTNLVATGTYSDSSTADLTASVAWNSSDTGVATVSAGVASGLAVGTTSITASQNGMTSPAQTLTVTSATLASIAISPTAPNVTQGITQQFTATGTYNNGTTGDVSGSVTWNSSNTAVSTLNATGLATTNTPGTTNITATSGTVTSNTAALTVAAPVLTSIAVTPANTTLLTRQTQQYTATGTYNNGSTADLTSTVTWSSSNTGSVTINTAGLSTVAYAGVGTANIDATSGTVTGSTALTSVLQQTWVSGSNTVNAAGVYGTKGVSAAANVPGARVDSVSWKDAAGNIWLFGGLGYATGSLVYLNDLWKYDPVTGLWTWVSGSSGGNAPGTYGTLNVFAAGNGPGAREASVSWQDTAGNLWLFGGYGYDSNGVLGYLNDLWKFSPSSGQWAWISGSSTVDSPGTYSVLNQTNNIPCARGWSASWITSTGEFWLFGGGGINPGGNGIVGSLNDLWVYTPATNKWLWLSGANTLDAVTVYGTKGDPLSGGQPGARTGSSSWIDAGGMLWLFGGSGGGNELWYFNPTTSNWNWVFGAANASGVYGTAGTASAANAPGKRERSITWLDSAGNFWLFGGWGSDSTGNTGNLADIWKYEPASGLWTWLSGSQTIGALGSYETLGQASATTAPASRKGAVSWIDASGNLWLFGGVGDNTNAFDGYRNDLWKVSP